MSINTIFGINGVGKDAVAECLKSTNQDIVVTSMSRLSMFLLGISSSWDAEEEVSEHQYRQLEETPQSKMIDLENNEYRNELEKIANSDQEVIMLSHLVSALRHSDKVRYLTERKTANWFVDLNSNLVELVAPPDMIVNRRKKDLNRDRTTDLKQIIEHQELCDAEWNRITKIGKKTNKNMAVVQNIDLQTAAREVENVFFR